MLRWLSIIVVVAACHPPDAAAPTSTEDPDLAALAHPWKIYGHVLAEKSAISEAEADALDGREVIVTATTYESPWQGSCADYARSRRTRALVEVAGELGIARAGLGLGARVAEIRLLCQNKRSPPLTMVVDGKHALTCWSGACYLLSY